jgi:GMP synthase (glutamine-hydrolysing)
MAGGEITSAENSSEYGKTVVYAGDSELFKGVPKKSITWMSHTDYVRTPPASFRVIARTDKCPCAAMCDEGRKLYGVQFHPEVTHTEFGRQMLRNFLFDVCGCEGRWKMDDLWSMGIEKYRRELGGKKVLLALSGGVDSSVAAVLFIRP